MVGFKSQNITCGCILEGALVSTEEGMRPIDTVHIGDRGFSPETGDFVDVINTWSGFERSDLTELTADGAKVTVTGEHPVFTPRRYVAAKSLKTSDTVLSGKCYMASVTVNKIPGFDAKVFNLDTEGNTGFSAGNGAAFWVGTNSMQNEILANGGR
jgi:hypothetical protein